MFKLAENLKKKRKGYTLVELVIVIIVISILAGVFFAMAAMHLTQQEYHL